MTSAGPHPRSWSIAVKVPLAAAALMLIVGVVLSERILTRLSSSQEQHLTDLTESYLDGLSTTISPSVLRDDVWEVFDAIEREQESYRGLHVLETIVADGDGVVIAASDPHRHPVGSNVPPEPAVAGLKPIRFLAGADTAFAARELSYPGRDFGSIRATFDTSQLAKERSDVFMALLATNGLLTLFLAAGGWMLMAWMMRPLSVLSQHLSDANEETGVTVPTEIVARATGEFGRLYRIYNTLIGTIREREELARRLSEEERLGSLGRLASSLAHEINNPLGGLFNALATLKSHGHLAHERAGAVGLLDRGLANIHEVVRTTLATYRAPASVRDLTSSDIDDLQLLIAPQARRKGLVMITVNHLPEIVAVSSAPIRQALLNLLLNAVAAAPVGSEIRLSAADHDGILDFEVRDRGPGLPAEAEAMLVGAYRGAPSGMMSGLGLWTTRRLIGELRGTIAVSESLGGGTVLRIVVPVEGGGALSDVA